MELWFKPLEVPLLRQFTNFFYSFYCVLRFSYPSWKDLVILLWIYVLPYHIFSYITRVNIAFSSSSRTRVNRKFHRMTLLLISAFPICLANISLWPLKNTFTIIPLLNIAYQELWGALDYFTKTTRFSMLLLSNVSCFLDFWKSLSYIALATYFTILHLWCIAWSNFLYLSYCICYWSIFCSVTL